MENTAKFEFFSDPRGYACEHQWDGIENLILNLMTILDCTRQEADVLVKLLELDKLI
mgnify:CR=1 FL=1